MNKAYRHGDCLLLKVSKIPKEAKLSKSNVLMTGSHGNNHSFISGQLYEFKKDNIVGYLRAKNTKLFHPEHSPNGVEIKDGSYRIIKQVEFLPEGMKPVVD